jgi:hypothetical protein
MGEFDLIARYFTRPVRRSPLGVGDDCALLQPRPGMQLAVSTDLLLEGRHFLSTVDPRRLGHKALAVNLSDLAACGARAARLHAVAGAAAGRRSLAGRLCRRPVRAGRRARLRTGRRRHHTRAAGDQHHRVRRSAGGPGPAALRRAGRRRPVGERHAGRCAAGAGSLPRHVSLPQAVFEAARCGWRCRSRAWRSGWRCAASRRPPSTSATACSATSAMC